MKILIVAFLTLFGSAFAKAQSIDNLLKQYNHHSVPYISVQELSMDYEDYVILDTRKKEEFDVSHLPNAIWVGEKWEPTARWGHDATIAVYCSVGIRSEDYGEQMQEAGFSKVRNLYGSIFAWKDAGFKLVDSAGKATENVHTYSKTWAKYLKTGNKKYGNNLKD
ncbi:rhodanese-like domain-containing protein [Nonlabens antarcticus]|uniref:rhodanese-like domain-containing protein n=1 Tax=Nonlabens antarcticus TaxID=392714 RepID=UPI00189100CF|nr:rhodanese-like domain-containing protein [Nonlabens antarcticus]